MPRQVGQDLSPKVPHATMGIKPSRKNSQMSGQAMGPTGTASSSILWTRATEGSAVVRVSEGDGGRVYTLERPEGVEEYSSARSLLIAVTGHQEARHWTFDRYFRLGKFSVSES